MAFGAKSVLNKLNTLVAAVSGVQKVYIGVPQSLDNKVSAFITMGGSRTVDKAAGLRTRFMNYRITLAYRVADAESTAETTMADLVDALEAALYADRTLGGTAESLEADFSSADDPRYAMMGSAEYREYPIVITVKQSRNYP